MSRPRVEDAPYEGWLAIAAAMGCHERTARRYAAHPVQRRRVQVAHDPFGRVYARQEWIAKWVADNTTTNKGAA